MDPLWPGGWGERAKLDAAARRVEDILREQLLVAGVTPDDAIAITLRLDASVGLAMGEAIRRTRGRVGVDAWRHYVNQRQSVKRRYMARRANRS